MPFKRHNPGCPCCDEISSSSSSVSSSSVSSSSSSSISSSIVHNPCDLDEDSTLYIKIELIGYEEEDRNLYSNCQRIEHLDQRPTLNGTYLIPITRTVVDGNPFFGLPDQNNIKNYTATTFTFNGNFQSTITKQGITYSPVGAGRTSGIVQVDLDGYKSEVGFVRPICDPSTWGFIGSQQSSGFTNDPNRCTDSIFITASGLLKVSIVPGPAP